MSDPVSRLNKALEGRYLIERELGQGGMATVYLADDLRHARKVALKVLRPELAAVVGAERFLAEIKTTAGLQHPNILPLFDSGEADGFLFYVMPYVKGESLGERLEREHQLPVEDAVDITVDLAEALDYAHRQGVIHRDIKPANVLMLEGKPVIADFGIALAVGAAGGGRLTETGLSVGTPYYMSPEQATGDLAVGPPADIYSLGAVLYEMLVGEPPYTGSSAQAILGKIITGAPESVTGQRPSVPGNVDAVIRRALEKVPADRFRTAKELADALRDPGFTHGDAVVGGATAAPGGWRTAAIAASVVALAAIVWGVVPRGDTTEETPEAQPMRISLVRSDPAGVRIVNGPVAISPDGSEVVFTGSVGGQRRLYRRSLATPELRTVSGVGEIASAPDIAFSPDGLSVAYTAFQDARHTLRRASIDGGRSTILATLPEYPFGISWSDQHGIVMGMFSWTEYHDLYRVELGDTAVVAVTGLPVVEIQTRGMRHGPYVLPGGDLALYLDYDPQGEALATVSLVTGERNRFELRDASFDGGVPVVGIADGVLLYLDETDALMAVGWDPAARSPVGVPMAVPGVPGGMREAALAADGTLTMLVGPEAYTLILVDDRGNPQLTLTADPVHGAYPRFSPDGRRIALSSDLQGGERGTWIYDMGSGLTSRLALGLLPVGLAWSTDGSSVLATPGFRRDGVGRMVSRPADGGEEARTMLSAPGWQLWSIDRTRNGGTLAAAANQSGSPFDPLDIVVRDLNTDTTFTPFVAGAANEVAPRFSPDGRWLAYASDESGVFQVYVRPFPGPGPRIQVSDAGGGQPVWSGDGRRLYYQTEDAIVSAVLDRSAPEGLSVLSREPLFRGELFGGPGSVAATYDVQPDGSNLIVTRAVGSGSTEIVMWRDWLGQLEQMLSERNP